MSFYGEEGYSASDGVTPPLLFDRIFLGMGYFFYWNMILEERFSRSFRLKEDYSLVVCGLPTLFLVVLGPLRG